MTQTTGETIDITVPDIGGAENVEIIEILVGAGDAVSVDESLVTLESDKASMEIPASHAGAIASIDVTVGDKVNEGDVIGKLQLITASGAEAENSDAAEPDTSASEATTNSQATESTASSSETESTDTSIGNAGVGEPAEASDSARSSSVSPTAHIDDDNIRKAHASPGVRRYAREHGADLSLIKGTGPKQRILKEDVIGFIKSALEGINSNYGSSGAATSGIPAIPEVDFTRFGDIERVELGRINKLSATNLHRAWLNVPMVTHHDEADITEMEAFRKALKQEQKDGDPKITGLAFHMKALVATLKAFPKVNSSMAPDGQSLIYKKFYHVGIAVDTAAGLVVPVFKDVDKKSITDLAAEMADVSQRARNKKLKPDELQGASMTISSLGGIGGSAFTPIVNPPEVAILGITRARMQPVWDGNEFIPRLMCPIDLSYDHRVVDGADAARFVAYYCKAISDVRRLLL